jgi:hypothetical protein
VPEALSELSGRVVVSGLGGDPKIVAQVGKQFGVDGLAAVPVPVAQPSPEPVSGDQRAQAVLNAQLGLRVDELVTSALKIEQERRSRRKDTLDRLIDEAASRARANKGGR